MNRLDAHMIRNLNLPLLRRRVGGYIHTRFAKLCSSLIFMQEKFVIYYREDNSTRSLRKVEYRQFISARHGRLGKENRRVMSFLYGFTNKKIVFLTYLCLRGLRSINTNLLS